MANKSKWSTESIETLTSLYTNGTKVSDISKILNISPKVISAKARKLNLDGPSVYSNLTFPNLTEKDKAYIGGIIDGEANIQILNHNRGDKPISYLPQLKINNTNPELIVYLKDKLEVGGLYYRHPGGNKRTDYVYTVAGWKCVSILRALKDYIFIKRYEVEIILEFASLKKTRRNYKLTDEIYQKRTELSNQLKELHHKIYPFHPRFKKDNE